MVFFWNFGYFLMGRAERGQSTGWPANGCEAARNQLVFQYFSMKMNMSYFKEGSLAGNSCWDKRYTNYVHIRYATACPIVFTILGLD